LCPDLLPLSEAPVGLLTVATKVNSDALTGPLTSPLLLSHVREGVVLC